MTHNRIFWLWVILGCIFIYLLYSLQTILFPFFLGLIGAYAFNRFVTFLEKYHFSRGVGSAIVILGFLVSMGVLITVFLPMLQQQLTLLAYSMPTVIEKWFLLVKPLLEQSSIDLGTPSPAELKTQVTSHIGDIINWVIRFLTNILTNGLALANILSLVVLTPIIMFYLLKDWPKIVHQVDQMIPLAYKDTIHLYARKVDMTLSEFAKGQALVCLILMALYSISLGLIGVPHGFFLGLITGFMSFIPYVGMITGMIATLAICLANFESWSQIVLVGGTFAAIGTLEGNLIAPRLIGEKVGLHPVWVLFALLSFANWFGFLGVIVALPVAAIIGVVVRLTFQWY